MPELVKVACHVPNGINLRLYRKERDPDNFEKMVPDGVGVRLNGPASAMMGVGNTYPPDLEPGVTEVDRDWIGKWIRQNAATELVKMRQVFLLDEETKDPNPTR